MSTKKDAQKSEGFSDFEKAAMKQRARELKEEANKVNDENAVLAAIAGMQEPDRGMAKRFHELVKINTPELAPKTWYGMPAYARDGKVVCFFQGGHKFKTRYSTIGFSDEAHLDEGNIWPAAFALKELTSVEEARIISLIKKAVS
jgi:uncharacterized protein YdhG (YjbR/CyaY superfamily)